MERDGRKEDRGRYSTRGTPLPSLTEIRKRRALSQRDLARLTGVATSTIHNLEHGYRTAYFSTARKLASAHGVSVEDLASGGG